MDFNDTPEEARFRAEARAWIDENAPRDWRERMRETARPLELAKEWQARKYDAGWACLHWPKEYGGRGASPIERVIWNQEEGELRQLSAVFTVGHGMCGPTMMGYATEEQKKRYLPPLARGDEIWCQLFSEPAAGSDLAGIRTRARRDGDEWVINGQKIWTSGAHVSDYAILVTRSDPTVPKHKGLTFFFIDMHAPGVEVRPIKQVSGGSEFNEVFFTDLRVPDSQRLGAVGDGWKVALTTLMHERVSVGGAFPTDFDEMLELAGRLELEDGPAIRNPAVRERLADWYVKASGLKYTGYRAISALSRGETPGPENSITKLVLGINREEMSSFILDLQGIAGALYDPDEAEMEALFQRAFFRSPGHRIEGGSDEILRNVIAERVLGLPADIRVDKDVPFNEIPSGGK
ncbi:MAG TPA: acyl-CoA dehydrogenase [Gammaproteobacteria bacterium]|nr:acyl-CoA dehydrogenase [Gammaproteobacteria bacterium]